MRWTLILFAMLMTAAGCRTRPWDDLPVPDLAVADLSIPPDLAAPRDFTVLPDLVPPPDLRPPKYCDGIFVFDTDRRLSFFDPRKLSFTDIAVLRCPGVAQNDSPFSMGVARDGTAWVEYTSGVLFKVDTYTGSCASTTFRPGQEGFTTFGMGFAADAPGSPDETLYIAGAPEVGLGRIDLKALAVIPIAPLPGRAELTGTGAGELWAFFAEADAHLGRIDKVTAAVNPDIPLPQIGDASGSGFAFGFFGGDFYVFLYRNAGSTEVFRYRPADGTVVRVLVNTGRHVVGAGVSTCAPQQ